MSRTGIPVGWCPFLSHADVLLQEKLSAHGESRSVWPAQSRLVTSFGRPQALRRDGVNSYDLEGHNEP